MNNQDTQALSTIVVNEEVKVFIPAEYLHAIKKYSENNGQPVSDVISEVICVGLDPYAGVFEKGSVEEKYADYLEQMKKAKDEQVDDELDW